MPVTPTYPGVYIEEIPSGVRTIVGVATSITAFIGRAKWGLIEEPTTVSSFGDFERMFGGLWIDGPMSYAVRDFFVNGGSQAVIVRLYRKKGTKDGIATADVGGATNKLTIVAASPGEWGNAVTAVVDYEGIDDDVAERYDPLTKNDLFNLTFRDTATGKTETFRNLSVKEGPRRVDRVLELESSLVRIKLDGTSLPANRPDSNDKPISLKDGGDGDKLKDTDYKGSPDKKTGLFALEKSDYFNLLCIPPDERSGDTSSSVYQDAMAFCAKHRALLIVDPPASWGANKDNPVKTAKDGLSGLGLSGTDARNAALFFPRVMEADSLRDGQLDTFVACGIIAGVMAKTDSQRGVWKAPAGTDAAMNGIQGLQVNLTDEENGQLNPIGINCLRSFAVTGRVVWGSRTLRGADQLADDYKYIPVRRLALFIEESLYRGTQWVVFEPNDEPLWAQIRLNVGAFMHNLFQQGAFQGSSPREAYFVKCDKETTTQYDIDRGVVNIVVGFAPLKPAEFVIIKITQIAGQSQA